jgi:hypothetical protein
MATKKTTTAAPTKQDQIEGLTQTVEIYRNQVTEAKAELEREQIARRENRDIGERWKKRATELEIEVGQLREELHGITVEKARLEGYIDRARQFDTEPEPVMVTVPEDMIRQPRNVSGRDFESMVSYGSKDRPQPWYKRDV